MVVSANGHGGVVHERQAGLERQHDGAVDVHRAQAVARQRAVRRLVHAAVDGV